MQNKHKNKVKMAVVIFFVLLFLFAQHVVSVSDVFNSNFAYLYALEVLFAVGQYGLLLYAKKRHLPKLVHLICLLLYIVVLYFGCSMILESLFLGMPTHGLIVLCVILDILGTIISSRCFLL